MVTPKALLGPFLFLIYINDIDADINDFVSKFVDDTNIDNVALSEGNRQSVHNFQKISDWSVIWEMPYDTNNCHIL